MILIVKGSVYLPGISSFHARRVSGLKKSDVLYGANVWLILNVVICVGTVHARLVVAVKRHCGR